MSSRRGKKNLTPEQEATFLQLVSFGMYPAQAARKVGVRRQAISMRKRRKHDFRDRVEQAEAAAEMGLLAHVLKAASKDWRAAMAILERRWPKRWARLESRVKVDVKATQAVVGASSQQVELLKQAIASIPGFAPGLVVSASVQPTKEPSP